MYRIVQEALTNILKHAGPAATAEVTLDYAGGAVDVQVTDTGQRRGSQSAPTATARACTGCANGRRYTTARCSAGPAPSGGWRVEAHLPAPDTTPAAS